MRRGKGRQERGMVFIWHGSRRRALWEDKGISQMVGQWRGKEEQNISWMWQHEPGIPTLRMREQEDQLKVILGNKELTDSLSYKRQTNKAKNTI